jgi:hypothetical protein
MNEVKFSPAKTITSSVVAILWIFAALIVFEYWRTDASLFAFLKVKSEQIIETGKQPDNKPAPEIVETVSELTRELARQKKLIATYQKRDSIRQRNQSQPQREIVISTDSKTNELPESTQYSWRVKY